MPKSDNDTIDLFAPNIAACPFHAYHELRKAESPYLEPRFGNYVLTRYHDVTRLRDHEHFSAEDGVDPAGPFPPGTYPDIERTDPPRHGRLKAFFYRSFSPQAIAGWRAQIDKIFTEHFDLIGDDTFDIVETICYPVPAAVICDIMGFSYARRGDFQRWSEALVERLGTEISADQKAALKEMATFIKAQAHARLEKPGRDLLSEMVHAEVDGARLTMEEIIAHGVFFLAAGHETTTNFMSNFAVQLAQEPALYSRLSEDRALLGKAIDESLRLESPVQNICRTVAKDVALGGKSITAGERIMFSLAAGNRDPSFFAHPDRFKLDRSNGHKHLAFGYGHHRCLGSRLAKLEGEIFAHHLLDRFERLEVVGEGKRLPGNVMRGYRHLWVKCRRRRN